MWLHRINQVLLVVVVGMVVKVVCATDLQPLQKSFHIYGCQSNETLERESDVDIHRLGARSRFLLGVSGTSNKTAIRLWSQSSSRCKLQPNKLYSVQPQTNGNNITFLLKTQRNRICNFRNDEQMTLQSGYGFISCQGNFSAGEEQWKEWLTAVEEVEAEAERARNKILIGVISGTCSMLVLIVAYVVCRLRCGPSTPYHTQRRPSNMSARTASTQDPHLSRT